MLKNYVKFIVKEIINELSSKQLENIYRNKGNKWQYKHLPLKYTKYDIITNHRSEMYPREYFVKLLTIFLNK
jgi:hypothetical protein